MGYCDALPIVVMAVETREPPDSLEGMLRKVLPEKSVTSYLRSWEEFRKAENIPETEMPKEDNYMHYFQYLRHEKKLKYTSLYCVFSKLNNCHQRIYGRRLQEWPKLMKLLKGKDPPESIRQTKSFTLEELKQFVLNPKLNTRYWLVRKAVITFAYFGSHRVFELRQLNLENLEFRKDGIHVTFKRVTKLNSQPKKLKYRIPQTDPRIPDPLENTCWVTTVQRYLNVLREDIEVTSGCLFYTARDFPKARFNTTPIGKNIFSRLGKEVAETLGKPEPEEYGGMCWGRMTSMGFKLKKSDHFMFPSHENQGDSPPTDTTQDLLSESEPMFMETGEFVPIKEECLSSPTEISLSESSVMNTKFEDSKESFSDECSSNDPQYDDKTNGTTLQEDDGFCDQFSFEDLVDKFANIVKFMASEASDTQAKRKLLRKLNSLPLGLVEMNVDPLSFLNNKSQSSL